jgi:hypothetical protein
MLETRLVAVIRGRAYYEILEDGRALFTGSLSECRRFEELHGLKRADAMRDKRIRDKPAARIFRMHVRSAAGSF